VEASARRILDRLRSRGTSPVLFPIGEDSQRVLNISRPDNRLQNE
jgi:hypothetical protein